MQHPDIDRELRTDVAVIGGGLAGLTAAGTAAASGASVVLLERQVPGGRASTDTVGRFRFNRGAHALYRGGPARAVLARLGIEVSAAPPPGTDAHGVLGGQVGCCPGATRRSPAPR